MLKFNLIFKVNKGAELHPGPKGPGFRSVKKG